ncbi:hypothetical protein [Mixta calida]|uniref:hypothetical protein n=1 Tax=Mixta calida TaxID=665913 RepID=UPI0035E3BD47
MKKIMLAAAAVLLSVSAAQAQPAPMDMSCCMNKKAPAPSMNEHELAIQAHQSMNNSSSAAHQNIIETHRKMMQEDK